MSLAFYSTPGNVINNGVGGGGFNLWSEPGRSTLYLSTSVLKGLGKAKCLKKNGSKTSCS